MSVIIFIVVLSFLVIIHELGHFFAARSMGMKIKEFGIGYPPRALKLFKWKETLFSLNWIPFGGFVAIDGEDEALGETQESKESTKKEVVQLPEKFNAFAINKRLFVVLAGPIVNFIFGILAFAIIFSISGIPTRLDQVRIKEVSPDSPAQKVGLMENVNLLAIEINHKNYPISSIEDAIDVIGNHRGETVSVTTTGECHDLECSPNKNTYQVYLRTEDETPAGQGSMGIVFQSVIYLDYPWYEIPFRGAWYGLMQALWLGKLILDGLGSLVSNMVTLGQIPDEIAGPVGIVHQATTEGIFAEGYLAILSFAGMLSINLAVMNVLPIPALDGGRALFILIEKLTGRKKIEKIEQYANYIGYLLLLGLIISVTIRDVIRIFA